MYPKSPVKSKWWSASNRLGITLADDTDTVSIYKDSLIRVGLVAVPSIQVDKIILKIAGNKPFGSDWESKIIKGNEAPHIRFPELQELDKGNYDARLYAYTPNGFARSEKFTVEFS